MEMQFVEGVIGMLTITVYDEIRKAVGGLGDLSTETSGDQNLRAGLNLVSDGAKMGVAFWVMSLLAAIAAFSIIFFAPRLRDKTVKSSPLRLWLRCSIICNMFRMASGFLIWAGVATVDEHLFCPNLAATGAIAAISFASALLDHCWRAYFRVEGASPFELLGSIFRSVASLASLSCSICRVYH